MLPVYAMHEGIERTSFSRHYGPLWWLKYAGQLSYGEGLRPLLDLLLQGKSLGLTLSAAKLETHWQWVH